MRFAECYASGESMKRCAGACKVSLTTAYRMRSRLEDLMKDKTSRDRAPAYRGFRYDGMRAY